MTSRPCRWGISKGQAGVSGGQLTQTLDCKTCHKEADKSIGPAFLLVVQKYQKIPKPVTISSTRL